MDDKLTFGIVDNVKPTTPRPGSRDGLERGELCWQTGMKGLADVEDPSEANGLDDTTVVERLDEETQGETSPGSNAIASSFPEKNSNTASCRSGDNAGKYEHATEGLGGRVYSG